jgi:hypothetical protein
MLSAFCQTLRVSCGKEAAEVPFEFTSTLRHVALAKEVPAHRGSERRLDGRMAAVVFFAVF